MSLVPVINGNIKAETERNLKENNILNMYCFCSYNLGPGILSKQTFPPFMEP